MSVWIGQKEIAEQSNQIEKIIIQLEKLNMNLNQLENVCIILTERLSYVLTEAGVKIKK